MFVAHHPPVIELSSPEPEEDEAGFSDLELGSLPASPASGEDAAAAAAPPSPPGAHGDPESPAAGPAPPAAPVLSEALAACDALLAPLAEDAVVPIAELNALRPEGLRTPVGAHAVAAALQAARRPTVRLRGQQGGAFDALNRQRYELYCAGRSLQQARGEAWFPMGGAPPCCTIS